MIRIRCLLSLNWSTRGRIDFKLDVFFMGIQKLSFAGGTSFQWRENTFDFEIQKYYENKDYFIFCSFLTFTLHENHFQKVLPIVSLLFHKVKLFYIMPKINVQLR